MKRIAIAGLQHETNTFSPIPTTYEDFTLPNAGRMLLAEDLRQLGSGRFNNPVSGFYDQAAALGFELIPLISFSTEPSNMTPMAVFDRLMDQLLDQLSAVECDGIFLDLHGAMALEGHLDGETEILVRLRERLRSRSRTPVVASLDLHGNLHPRSVELCTGFVACREYPHIDMFETGQRCAQLMAYALSGKPLFKAFRSIPFLMPSSKETTFREPSKSLYAMIGEVERRAGVISASILQGFSGSDVEYTGPSLLVYADTQQTADREADFLYNSILARESEFDSQVPGAREGVATAIRLAQTADKPVILADIQDNAGGGYSSDTMFIIKEMLAQNVSGAAAAMIYDPQAAAAAHAAGRGAVIELALGGKYIPGDSPLKAAFRVERLHDGPVTGTGPMARGMQFHFGKMALLRVDDLLIVVSSRREQAADQAVFTCLGVEPAHMKILLVKSANHFRADFTPIASHVIDVLAPGSDVEDPSTFTYRYLRSGVRLKGGGPTHRLKE